MTKRGEAGLALELELTRRHGGAWRYVITRALIAIAKGVLRLAQRAVEPVTIGRWDTAASRLVDQLTAAIEALS